MAVSARHQGDLRENLGRRHDGGGDFWSTADGRWGVGSPFSIFDCALMIHELGLSRTDPVSKATARVILDAWQEDGRFRPARGRLRAAHRGGILVAMQVAKTVEIRAEPAAVWNALTDPERTKQYFFACEAHSDWKVGSVLDYRCEIDGSKVTVVTGEIRAIDPPRYLEVTCRGVQGGVEGEETVATYTLTTTDGGTRLSITQGEFAEDGQSDQHASSWDLVLSGLKALLEG